MATREEIEKRKSALESLKLEREAQLASKDYVASKIAEGRATREEYAAVITQKTQWAADINAAKEEIATLQAQLDEMSGEGEEMREESV